MINNQICGDIKYHQYALLTATENTEKVEEEIDEVKIQRQSANSSEFACVGHVGLLCHLLDFLGVPSSQTNEDYHTSKTDNPAHSVTLQEDVDYCAYNQSNKRHYQE